MADRARRRLARRARSKVAAAAPAAGRPRHPAGVAPVAAARRAVAAALPPRYWTAVTDVPALVRPGRCAARDRPLGLTLFLAAEKVARSAVDPGAEPASPSGVSAAGNSSGHRDAAAAAGPAPKPAAGRDRRHRAVDWLNSPPSPRLHARKSPSKRRVSEIVVPPQQSGSEKAKRQPCAARYSRMLADFHRAAHDFSLAFSAAIFAGRA
jgi:hypothetical protein